MSVNVVIADDSPALRHAIRRCLQAAGFKVCGEAENGRDAVQLVQQLQPDVVVLDFQMPVMTGIEAATQIPSGSPKTAMILLTLYSSEQLVRDARRVGIKRVLSKEEGIEHLLNAVGELVTGSSAAAARDT